MIPKLRLDMLPTYHDKNSKSMKNIMMQQQAFANLNSDSSDGSLMSAVNNEAKMALANGGGTVYNSSSFSNHKQKPVMTKV